MNNKIILPIIGFVAIFLGGCGAQANVPAAQNNKTQSQGGQNIITYSDSGYAPASLKVKEGEAVIFKNESSKSMWTASGAHPTHRLYDGTSLSEHCPSGANSAFDACKAILPADSWSFTFTKKGTWKYHNHLNPTNTGSIVVE